MHITRWLATLISATALGSNVFAAGTLQPKGSPDAPIQIRDHAVKVILNNGFAETEVVQTFFNPNPVDLEAVYRFPLPKSASLSEVTITSGETTIQGEVLAKPDAAKAYEEEKAAGNDAGLASKNGFQSFDFAVSPVRANAETKIRFLYYQPLEIDTAVGRYLYPLAEGGTDELATSFWTRNEKVEGRFAIDVELKSGWPIDEVRAPGYENDLQVTKLGDGHYRAKIERSGAALDRDFVFYYRLAENLPGRVELVTYKPDVDQAGTFMMVVTPGLDLTPIQHGADYVFVLDVSGSMSAKLGTLGRGVIRTLQQMRPEDRFRIVLFAGSARDLMPGGRRPATRDNVDGAIRALEQLSPEDSTDIYAGLQLALTGLDADRATSIILVTDGVTNTGVVEPKAFYEMLKKYDLRVFGFVMGNSGNWPLMETIAEATGGFATGVSNDDDIVGQILLAKSKITSQALHDASFKISGVKTYDATDEFVGKIYRGQQLVFFGRYGDGGTADVTLSARLTGQDQTYRTRFDFPDQNTDHPELERLWALDRIEAIQAKERIGQLPASEAQSAVKDLGLAYQLVTDETSMVVLTDQAFASRGIERRNQTRVAIENAAKAIRSAQAPVNHRVDQNQPMYSSPAPTLSRRSGGGGGGGGAIDPLTAVIAGGLALAALVTAHRRAANA